MVLVTAVPAFATIHELAAVPEDNPGGDNQSEVAGNFPPGLSDAEGVGDIPTEDTDGHTFKNENGSDNSDTLNLDSPRGECPKDKDPLGSCEGNFAQAVVSVGQGPAENPSEADEHPVNAGDSTNALESSNPGNKVHDPLFDPSPE